MRRCLPLRRIERHSLTRSIKLPAQVSVTVGISASGSENRTLWPAFHAASEHVQNGLVFNLDYSALPSLRLLWFQSHDNRAVFVNAIDRPNRRELSRTKPGSNHHLDRSFQNELRALH